MPRAVDSWTGPTQLDLAVYVILGILLVGVLVVMWRRSRSMSQIAELLAELQRGHTPGQLPETGPVSMRGITRAFNDLAGGKKALIALQALGHDPPAIQPALREVAKALDWLDAMSAKNAAGGNGG